MAIHITISRENTHDIRVRLTDPASLLDPIALEIGDVTAYIKGSQAIVLERALAEAIDTLHMRESNEPF